MFPGGDHVILTAYHGAALASGAFGELEGASGGGGWTTWAWQKENVNPACNVGVDSSPGYTHKMRVSAAKANVTWLCLRNDTCGLEP